MKARIIITDDQGKVWEGETILGSSSGRAVPVKASTRSHSSPPPGHAKLDFGRPLRALMKEHARSRPVPQKFALLVAGLTKGMVGKPVASTDIKAAWERMTGVMGEFNPVHSTRAKENGWVDSPKYGFFTLTPTWIEVLGKK